MSERKSISDEKFVVKFPLISQRLWGYAEQKCKSTEHKRCKRCSVLLLNIDFLLETETISLKTLERQFNICRNKCRKRGIRMKGKNVNLSSLSSPESNVASSSEAQEYTVVVKQEPLSPSSSLPKTENADKGALSELPCSTETAEPSSDEQHHHDPVVEVKVEVVDPTYEEYTYNATTVKKEDTDDKIRGINKEFRIKQQPPCKPTHDLYDTKATDMLRQAIAKTAIVQPTVFTSSNTVTASTPLIQNVLSNMQTPATLSVASVSTQSPIWDGNNFLSSKSVNSSRPTKQVNNSSKDMNKVPISKIPSSSSPLLAPVSSKEMSVLQLMNGQMVLVPTQDMKNLCAKYPSLVNTADISQNVNLPSVPSSGVAGTLPIISTVPQPTIAILPPTGPNVITPSLTSQLFNIPGQTNSNLLGQQGLGNQLVLMPQTGNSNTLLLQPGGNQSTNLFAMSNSTSIQMPNVPVVQQLAAPFIPALPTTQPSNENKTSENLPQSKSVIKTSFLRLADGQLVPIVSNPSSFSQNMSMTSAALSKDSPKLSLATNMASPIPCIAQMNGNPQLQYLVPAVPIQEKSTPGVMQSASTSSVYPSVNEQMKQGTTQFIQFTDGSLIPIATTVEQNQLSSQINKTGPANEKLSKQSLTVEQKQVPSPSAASELLKNNNKPSIVPQQTQSLNLPSSGISSFFVMDGNNASVKNFQLHNSFHTPTSTGSDVKTPDNGAKKQQPVILQSNRPKPWPRSVRHNRATHARHAKNWSNTIKTAAGASYFKIAPKQGSSDTPPQFNKSAGKGHSQQALGKLSNKRKPVNVVREDFDVHNRKRPKTYFTHEVIDVDEEPDPPATDEEGRPRFMFMRNVKQPEYRPVLLDSTIEEKGLRIPDNMLL